MARIHIYKGALTADAFAGCRAEISFSGSPSECAIPNSKVFSSDEVRKGLEQMKRWVSTGAFKAIVISGLSEALEKGDKAHLLEWIQDHSTEPDFPSLILIGEKGDRIEGLITDVIEESDLKNLINA